MVWKFDVIHKTGNRNAAKTWLSQGHRQHAQKLRSSVVWIFPCGAILARYNAVVACLCVCLCVSVSDTRRYCIKTVNLITKTTPHVAHDRSETLVFWRQRTWRNSNGVTPNGGAKCTWVGWIRRISTKTGYNSKTVQDRRIVSIKVQL